MLMQDDKRIVSKQVTLDGCLQILQKGLRFMFGALNCHVLKES